MNKRLISAFLLLIAAGSAHAGVLTTTFASNNGQSGNMFDVNVLGNALNVTAFDVNLNPGTYTLEIYTKSGSYVGSEATAADWTLIDTLTGVTSAGTDLATFIDVADFILAAGSTSALYITTTTGGMNYTNGTAVGNVAAANADLQILEGAGKSYAFGSTFQPRIWNGTIYYSTVPAPTSLAIMAIGLVVFGLQRRRNADA